MSIVRDTIDDLRKIGNIESTANSASSVAGSKQDTLVSGTNIKTVGGNSILGSGDLEIGGGVVEGFYPEQFVMEGIYTTSTSITIPNGAKSCMAYVFGKGGDSVANTSSGGGGGCAYGKFSVASGESLTLTIGTTQGGTSKLTYNGVDLLTAIGANTSTAGTASKHESVINGGAYSGGSGATLTYCGGASSGSPFGSGKDASSVISDGGGSSWTYTSLDDGGAGLGETSSSSYGGSGLASNLKIVDPLINYFKPFAGRSYQIAGNQSICYGAGSGSSRTNTANPQVSAGFGAGGGVAGGQAVKASSGGFGGGGGAGKSSTGTSIGGDGGLGGGGAGTGINTGGIGGSSCIIIFWSAS